MAHFGARPLSETGIQPPYLGFPLGNAFRASAVVTLRGVGVYQDSLQSSILLAESRNHYLKKFKSQPKTPMLQTLAIATPDKVLLNPQPQH